jgi:hypothetical protein
MLSECKPNPLNSSVQLAYFEAIKKCMGQNSTPLKEEGYVSW